jgi:hypothetical protein
MGGGSDVTGVAGTAGTAGSPGAAGTSAAGGTTGAAGTIAAAGTTGTVGRGGTSAAAGTTGNAGRGGSAGTGTTGAGGTGGAGAHFSFFVTSVQAMKDLSGNPQGFGGDLRYGETGDGAGLRGADKLCAAVAERSMPGAGTKPWRAFLSAVAGPVHAIDRIGSGPWYDRMGRLVASSRAMALMERPGDADPAIKDDLPNEYGIPNHTDGAPGCTGNTCPDNHDTLTGTGTNGMLYRNDMAFTCNDWTTSANVAAMGPWVGHSWPRTGSGRNWMSALREGGCAPGINLMEMGGPMPGVYTVGTGGGYGGIYCFALTP